LAVVELDGAGVDVDPLRLRQEHAAVLLARE